MSLNFYKIWESRPEALRVGEPGENTGYASSLEGGGGVGGRWGENCYRGLRDVNFTRTGRIIKQNILMLLKSRDKVCEYAAYSPGLP